MKTQLNALTSTRAFAAIMVYIFHFGRDIFPFNKFPPLFYRGNVAVSYFFVLSGFVLYYSYSGRSFTYVGFIKKRLARIAPVYYLALLFSVIISLCVYHNSYSADLIRQIIYSAFFLQAYSLKDVLSINTAAWSISVEMLFYLAFPFLLYLEKKNGRRFLVAIIILYVISQLIVCMLFYQKQYVPEDWPNIMYNPLVHINEFLIGMGAGYLFINRDKTQKKYSWLPAFLFCLILLFITNMPGDVFFVTGLMSPVFAVFIISLAINDAKLLNARPLVFLGEISYGIYILQFPVQAWLHDINGRSLHLSDTTFFYFSLIMLVFFSTMTFVFFEKPLRNKINSIRFGK